MPASKRKMLATVFGGVALVMMALIVAIFAGVFTPSAPAGWSQVHAGMTRSEVIALAGKPQQSGWPEKISETWYQDGVLTQRRLSIVYEGEVVRIVWNGTWIHGYGWSHLRREPQE